MSGLTAILRELLGLFIEDGALALAIVAVIIAAGFIAWLVPDQSLLIGGILLLGCLGVLFVNVMQAGQR
jgi:hypothetical protein